MPLLFTERLIHLIDLKLYGGWTLAIELGHDLMHNERAISLMIYENCFWRQERAIYLLAQKFKWCGKLFFSCPLSLDVAAKEGHKLFFYKKTKNNRTMDMRSLSCVWF